MNNKGISKKKKRMTIDEFNKAFKMIHAVYRAGTADEDDDGVDDLRKAIEGLIATNLPGRFSTKKTVAEIKLIHGDHKKTCLVLEGSMVRKDDLKGLDWEGRQEFIQERIDEGKLVEHSDGEHYVLAYDVKVDSSNKSLQFVSGTQINSNAEIFWFSKKFTWKSRYNSAISIKDWLGDEESMKQGITLEEYRKRVLKDEET